MTSYGAVSSLDVLNDLTTRIARDAEGKRAEFSLHELPASDLHLGDVLLDDDYNAVGVVTKTESIDGMISVRCFGASTYAWTLDPDDIVAVLRSAS